MADGKRGVNDPGVAWPVRPQAIVCGGRSRPAVSMSDEAREQPSSSGGFAGTGRCSFGLAGCHQRGRPYGHHVREHAHSVRRRARFCAALRPRAVRAARACQSASWTIVVFGERETLTAPRRARNVGIYMMAGRVDIREGSRDLQLQAISEVQRPCVLDVQHATWQVALRLRRRVDDERRMATTPPAGTGQSTAGISVVSRAMSDSINRPSLCVPGSTRSGPLSGRESSRCRRRATTCAKAEAGARA